MVCWFLIQLSRTARTWLGSKSSIFQQDVQTCQGSLKYFELSISPRWIPETWNIWSQAVDAFCVFPSSFILGWPEGFLECRAEGRVVQFLHWPEASLILKASECLYSDEESCSQHVRGLRSLHVNCRLHIWGTCEIFRSRLLLSLLCPAIHTVPWYWFFDPRHTKSIQDFYFYSRSCRAHKGWKVIRRLIDCFCSYRLDRRNIHSIYLFHLSHAAIVALLLYKCKEAVLGKRRIIVSDIHEWIRGFSGRFLKANRCVFHILEILIQLWVQTCAVHLDLFSPPILRN